MKEAKVHENSKNIQSPVSGMNKSNKLFCLKFKIYQTNNWFHDKRRNTINWILKTCNTFVTSAVGKLLLFMKMLLVQQTGPCYTFRFHLCIPPPRLIKYMSHEKHRLYDLWTHYWSTARQVNRVVDDDFESCKGQNDKKRK